MVRGLAGSGTTTGISGFAGMSYPKSRAQKPNSPGVRSRIEAVAHIIAACTFQKGNPEGPKGESWDWT